MLNVAKKQAAIQDPCQNKIASYWQNYDLNQELPNKRINKQHYKATKTFNASFRYLGVFQNLDAADIFWSVPKKC